METIFGKSRTLSSVTRRQDAVRNIEFVSRRICFPSSSWDPAWEFWRGRGGTWKEPASSCVDTWPKPRCSAASLAEGASKVERGFLLNVVTGHQTIWRKRGFTLWHRPPSRVASEGGTPSIRGKLRLISLNP